MRCCRAPDNSRMLLPHCILRDRSSLDIRAHVDALNIPRAIFILALELLGADAGNLACHLQPINSGLYLLADLNILAPFPSAVRISQNAHLDKQFQLGLGKRCDELWCDDLVAASTH